MDYEHKHIDAADEPALQKAYDAALAANAFEFTFKGAKMYTAYAKYVLEYFELKRRMKP